ncbi:HAMP domain-containing histidine kinase, partial [Blautia pseudococcoides]|nr:HAMP domain-containing histidine kinase [Blautia pseudococcoides]
IGLIGAVAIPFSLILAGTSTGLITYADYSERSAKNLAPVIAATPDLTDVQLPMGCKYLVLDKNYQVTETTLGGDDLDRAMEYAISGKINTNLNKQYLLVTRENEYVVLQYYIGSQFTNEWLYEHFPSPEILLYILITINCITVCVILTAKFAKNMRAQLSPLFEATRQVAGQNLDFEVGHSKIKEFEDVLCSFANMKDNLKISLEKQWHAEQLQREQIAALAHDLKTPLTVIQGNIDLISETELNEEQKLYARYITESSEQMFTYIKLLIDLSRVLGGYQLKIEEVNVDEYIQHIKMQVKSLCDFGKIHLQMKILSMPKSLKIDILLMDRAILNVVDNALEHSSKGGTLYIEVRIEEKYLVISIIDEGIGFSREALRYAQDKFFMDDHS